MKYKHTEEAKRKISIFFKGKKHSLEHRRKISEANRGRKHTQQTIKKMSKSRKKRIGFKLSEDTRRKISESMKGPKNYNWKGGITGINYKIRNSLEYRLWREAVFKRDNYQCIWGGKEHGKKIQADHIKKFALYPELRFAIDNGRTLCEDCHKKVTYGVINT